MADVSRADGSSTLIAKTEIKPDGRQVPIPFELPYDSWLIDKRHRYAIQVKIFEGTTLRFTNRTAYLVITNGKANSVNIIVQPI